jgi:hypothetical protein
MICTFVKFWALHDANTKAHAALQTASIRMRCITCEILLLDPLRRGIYALVVIPERFWNHGGNTICEGTGIRWSFRKAEAIERTHPKCEPLMTAHIKYM